MCAKAGLRPRFAEPDLLCDFGGQTWGLAVKRVKSLAMLKERFDSAATQIDRADVAGFVVADLSAARNPDNVRIDATEWEEFELHAHSETWDFALPCERLMRRWRQGTRVRGALLLEHHVFSL